MTGIVVKPEIAAAQVAQDEAAASTQSHGSTTGISTPSGLPIRAAPYTPGASGPEKKFRRFYGSVALDPIRASRDVARVAEEVIQHLTTLEKANVTIRLELEASTPDGVPDNVFRTVLENCRTLKFTAADFEES